MTKKFAKKVGLISAILLVAAATYMGYSWYVGGGIVESLGFRPGRWAKPINEPHLPNFHQVSPDLYRGAQPEAAGMKRLEELGIRTVVNLRKMHTDDDELEGTSLSSEHFRMLGVDPEDEDVVAFLRVVLDENRTPVFVHCKHGSDRTGFMCAAYRVIVQGWDRHEAAREMRDGGFGFHKTAYGHLVGYIAEDMDVDKIKRQLALK